jgi:hypothetical protein
MFNKSIITLSIFMVSSSVMASVNKTMEQADYINPDVLKFTLISSFLFLALFVMLILLARKSRSLTSSNIYRIAAVLVLIIFLSIKYSVGYDNMNILIKNAKYYCIILYYMIICK